MRRVLFGFLSVLLCCGCLCSGCACPSSYGYKDWQEYRQKELADRTKKTQPVIDALEKYKSARGNYPQTLEELVTAGLLATIPDLASNLDHQGKAGRVEKAGPLRYEVGDDDYRLRFSFSYTEQAGTSMKDWRLEYKPGHQGWQPLYGPETRPRQKP